MVPQVTLVIPVIPDIRGTLVTLGTQVIPDLPET